MGLLKRVLWTMLLVGGLAVPATSTAADGPTGRLDATRAVVGVPAPWDAPHAVVEFGEGVVAPIVSEDGRDLGFAFQGDAVIRRRGGFGGPGSGIHQADFVVLLGGPGLPAGPPAQDASFPSTTFATEGSPVLPLAWMAPTEQHWLAYRATRFMPTDPEPDEFVVHSHRRDDGVHAVWTRANPAGPPSGRRWAPPRPGEPADWGVLPEFADVPVRLDIHRENGEAGPEERRHAVGVFSPPSDFEGPLLAMRLASPPRRGTTRISAVVDGRAAATQHRADGVLLLAVPADTKEVTLSVDFVAPVDAAHPFARSSWWWPAGRLGGRLDATVCGPEFADLVVSGAPKEPAQVGCTGRSVRAGEFFAFPWRGLRAETNRGGVPLTVLSSNHLTADLLIPRLIEGVLWLEGAGTLLPDDGFTLLPHGVDVGAVPGFGNVTSRMDVAAPGGGGLPSGWSVTADLARALLPLAGALPDDAALLHALADAVGLAHQRPDESHRTALRDRWASLALGEPREETAARARRLFFVERAARSAPPEALLRLLAEAVETDAARIGALMEAHLGTFLDEARPWFDHPDLPEVELTLTAEAEGTRIEARQITTGEGLPMTLRVRLDAGLVEKSVSLRFEGGALRAATFVPFAVRGGVADPDRDWPLAFPTGGAR